VGGSTASSLTSGRLHQRRAHARSGRHAGVRLGAELTHALGNERASPKVGERPSGPIRQRGRSRAAAPQPGPRSLRRSLGGRGFCPPIVPRPRKNLDRRALSVRLTRPELLCVQALYRDWQTAIEPDLLRGTEPAPATRKVPICRGFEAADGTRTHDLLHGKKNVIRRCTPLFACKLAFSTPRTPSRIRLDSGRFRGVLRTISEWGSDGWAVCLPRRRSTVRPLDKTSTLGHARSPARELDCRACVRPAITATGPGRAEPRRAGAHRGASAGSQLVPYDPSSGVLTLAVSVWPGRARPWLGGRRGGRDARRGRRRSAAGSRLAGSPSVKDRAPGKRWLLASC
jgi:hypothetical protein